MSSRSRNRLAVAAAVAMVLAGCDREERHSRPKPFGEQVPAGAQRSAEQLAFYATYERNARHIAEGHRLFVWMNCVGCHGNGGGGMGPPLMDAEWRYGGRIDQIAETIVEGRPNGMPSFRGMLTADQVWQLAAYVRSLSGQTRKDAVPGRVDAMSSIPPPSEMVEEPIVPEDMSDQ